ncbi:MAG TPA: hypothetical protein VHC90_11440 [Bryobacteraceae bacterium]|nr:hypothetical protein [Bryobacteraceae bacterium]
MGFDELDSLSKSYGFANALLIFAVLGLAYAIRVLYRENRSLHERLEQLSYERVKALETVLDDQAPHPRMDAGPALPAGAPRAGA